MLRWAIAGPVGLLALLAVTFLLLIRWLNSEVDLVDHTDRVISAAQETQALLIDMETGVRGYLLSNDPVFLAPYRRAAPVVHPAFNTLRELVSDNATQIGAVNRLEQQYSDWKQLAEKMIVASNPDVLAEAQIAGKAQMDTIRRSFGNFVTVEERLRAERTATSRRVSRVVVATSAVVTLLFGVIAGVFTRRALHTVASEYEDSLRDSELARTRAEALARENERLFLEAESASRAKDEFLATLSHELRTPLTAILGWARLLQIQGTDQANIGIAIEAIERSARSQAALIEDILDVSRIITGKLKLELEDVDVRDAVRQAADSLQPAAAAKKISIEIDASDAIRLRADPNRLQQIIWNLLANAVKFSPSNTRVRVVAGQENGDVVLTVNDQGRGIDREFLPFVFDRFRQADSSSTREYGGLGIGLAVVKLLVELHGGTVTAESDGRDKGATFRVVFPSHATSQLRSEHPLVSHGADLIHEIGQPLAGRDVLVVDDDSDARTVIAAMLRTFGGRVEVASSVGEAMRYLGKHKFAVVVTDIAMPHESGLSLLQRLRLSHGPNTETPVVGVTALATPAEAPGRSPFAAMIRKPIDPAVLASTVAGAIVS
jgi:signal transduction histidine kinase